MTDERVDGEASEDGDEDFASRLESRLEKRSDQLEEIHLEAAIDAQLTVLGGSDSNARPVIKVQHENDQVIFDDYTNPNAVANCLSPYVPSSADRIQSFVKWVELAPFDRHGGDVLLDLGCGDGRVCIAASKLSGKINFVMNFYISMCLCLLSHTVLSSFLSQDAERLVSTCLHHVLQWPKRWPGRKTCRRISARFMKRTLP